MVATTLLSLALETNKKKNGFDLDVIVIEVGVFKNKSYQGMTLLTL